MTGLRSQTANYPGITVDLRKANIRLPIEPKSTDESRFADINFDGYVDLIDLPGLYGLEPTSPEEVIAADSIRGNIGGDVALVVVVLDATNLARNLFLAEEILELGQPCVIALNMMDVASAKGIHVDTDALADRLECPIVKVSARTGDGIDQLKSDDGRSPENSAGTVGRPSRVLHGSVVAGAHLRLATNGQTPSATRPRWVANRRRQRFESSIAG